MCLCNIAMTTRHRSWSSQCHMSHRLVSWWQPPKICMITLTSYNTLIMYVRVYMGIIFLLSTTWNRLTNKLVLFFNTKNSKNMAFYRETLLSGTYFKVIKMTSPCSRLLTETESLIFVFISGFMHNYWLPVITCINMIVSDREHLSSLSSFFISKRAHTFLDMMILTSSVWYHNIQATFSITPMPYMNTKREFCCESDLPFGHVVHNAIAHNIIMHSHLSSVPIFFILIIT